MTNIKVTFESFIIPSGVMSMSGYDQQMEGVDSTGHLALSSLQFSAQT